MTQSTQSCATCARGCPAVEITPDGEFVQIAGKIGCGASSEPDEAGRQPIWAATREGAVLGLLLGATTGGASLMKADAMNPEDGARCALWVSQ